MLDPSSHTNGNKTRSCKFYYKLFDLWSYCEVLTLSINMRLLSRSTDVDIEERNTFSEWILGVGDGSIRDTNNVDIIVQILHDILIPSLGDPLSSIIESTYPNLLQIIYDPSFFRIDLF